METSARDVTAEHRRFIPKRYALLIQLDSELDPDEYDINDVDIVELRAYDMKDHEQVAIQFTRELVIQGRNPDPLVQRIVVIGGDSEVTVLDGTDMPVERVSLTVWEPVPPPPTPMWTVNQKVPCR